MDRSTLAAMLDHTLLDPLATAAGVEGLCQEAIDWSIGHVCVSPTRVAVAVRALDGAGGVCSVVGFASGAHLASVKAAEAAAAVEAGATEIDMVVNLGLVADEDWDALQSEVAQVVAAAGDAPVKAILESAALNGHRLRRAALAAIDGGARWLKTSTGYHPSGGATVEAVALLVEAAQGRAAVKASGGIRSLASAQALLNAGATRLGTSRSVEILAELA